MNYHILREIADSWVLLVLFAFFVGAVIWAFRPGSSAAYRDTANIPFRNETAPDTSDEAPQSAGKQEAST